MSAVPRLREIPPIRWRGGRDLLGTPGVFDVRWCSCCGLGVTDPRPTDILSYPTGYHAVDLHDDPPTFRLRWLVLARRAPGAALDVGAGDLLAAARAWRSEGSSRRGGAAARGERDRRRNASLAQIANSEEV